EGVGGLLKADGGRHGRLTALAGGEDLLGPLLQRRGLVHGQREAGVGGGVFVGAVDDGVVGQRRQPLQAGPHLLGGAFEDPPAAQREQGVADERDLVGLAVV